MVKIFFSTIPQTYSFPLKTKPSTCTCKQMAETARLMTSVCIFPQRVIAARKHALGINMALENRWQKQPGWWPVYVSSHNALLQRGNMHWATTWHLKTDGRNSQADDQCMYPPTTRYCSEETCTGQQHGTWKQMAETARLMTSVCILPQRVIAARKHALGNNMASHITYISMTTGHALEYGGQWKLGWWPGSYKSCGPLTEVLPYVFEHYNHVPWWTLLGLLHWYPIISVKWR